MAKSLRTKIKLEVMETVTEGMAAMELPRHLPKGVTRTRDDVGSVLTILHTPKSTGFHILKIVLQVTWSIQTNGGKNLPYHLSLTSVAPFELFMYKNNPSHSIGNT